jgi:hypothetical protein
MRLFTFNFIHGFFSFNISRNLQIFFTKKRSGGQGGKRKNYAMRMLSIEIGELWIVGLNDRN